ncbi:MAG TPA: hydrogenase formation protein HypD [Polyangiaceae bacterium]|nr:hydrogenase formation protein HypD [Polyangiaceae bacterium]
MKYVDEYRDPALSRRLLDEIARVAKHRAVIMEICGGQTHAIVRYGIDELLPPAIELVHGPGCPVCVTSLETIDRAHAIAQRDDVIFASFGDMLRVPGSTGDLLSLKARGADVRVVYAPLDALAIAKENPDRSVVFFGIGFETTAPANAMALREAKRLNVANFSMLVSHVLVPPAIAGILDSPDNRVRAFLGPGNVCTVTGFRDYVELAARYHVPIVVTGFEPIDLLEGILLAVRQLESGRAEVENQYARSVLRDGNRVARELVDQVFEVTDRNWRGIGKIAKSGLAIRREYAEFDAETRFPVSEIRTCERPECISGLVLRGQKKPCDCPAFGRACTPSTPLGATMVSSEGACAAYFQNGRHLIRGDGAHVA